MAMQDIIDPALVPEGYNNLFDEELSSTAQFPFGYMGYTPFDEELSSTAHAPFGYMGYEEASLAGGYPAQTSLDGGSINNSNPFDEEVSSTAHASFGYMGYEEASLAGGYPAQTSLDGGSINNSNPFNEEISLTAHAPFGYMGYEEASLAGGYPAQTSLDGGSINNSNPFNEEISLTAHAPFGYMGYEEASLAGGYPAQTSLDGGSINDSNPQFWPNNLEADVMRWDTALTPEDQALLEGISFDAQLNMVLEGIPAPSSGMDNVPMTTDETVPAAYNAGNDLGYSGIQQGSSGTAPEVPFAWGMHVPTEKEVNWEASLTGYMTPVNVHNDLPAVAAPSLPQPDMTSPLSQPNMVTPGATIGTPASRDSQQEPLEPTCWGLVPDKDSALALVRRCLAGELRWARRMRTEEKFDLLKHGAIFVFPEARVKRWQDGVSWTISRGSAGMFQYHELRDARAVGGKMKVDAEEHRRNQGIVEAKFAGFPCRHGGLLKQVVKVVVDGEKYSVISYWRKPDEQRRRQLNERRASVQARPGQTLDEACREQYGETAATNPSRKGIAKGLRAGKYTQICNEDFCSEPVNPEIGCCSQGHLE